LFSHQIAFYIHRERQQEIERRLALRHIARSQIRNRSIRWRLGHALIQLGSAIASEAPMTLVPRR